ncbi:MAG: phosphatidylinositol-specific phospholipase C domain-containing protein [Akkermansiaceae bacterium]
MKTLLVLLLTIAPLCAASPRYDEVTWLCTHNAMNTEEDGWKFPNQTHSIPKQLKNGVRALMLDIWDQDGKLVLRHGPPIARFFGSRPLSGGLNDIHKFLQQDQTAIITLILESKVSAARVVAAIRAAKLDSYCHSQDASKPWPPLSAMRKSGKRLVILSDRVEQGANIPTWYMPVWNHCWETNWEAKNLAQLSAAKPRRGKRTNALFILNHFVTNGMPSKKLSTDANSNPFLTNRVNLVMKKYKTKPNFLVLDFYEQGNGTQVVKDLNGNKP